MAIDKLIVTGDEAFPPPTKNNVVYVKDTKFPEKRRNSKKENFFRRIVKTILLSRVNPISRQSPKGGRSLSSFSLSLFQHYSIPLPSVFFERLWAAALSIREGCM